MTIAEADAFERALAQKVNATRRAQRLPPLRRSQDLAQAAQAKSHEMARLGYFGHTSADGTPFWRDVMANYSRRGYRSWVVGENLAWGPPNLTATTVIQRWLNSPLHRKNLLGRNFREFGIGAIVATNARGYWKGRGDVKVIALEFGARRR